MAERNATIIALHAREALAGQAEIARLAGWDEAHGVEVEYANGRRACAETTMELDAVAWQRAIAQARRVLVVPTASGVPVVTGFVQTPGQVPSPSGEVVVRVDGDRLVLHGREEIELRCGRASLVLRRTGEVEIRGEKVASRSRGANVVTGASIRLN